jgi:D-sedoheptulose 7-phosphate isomerase
LENGRRKRRDIVQASIDVKQALLADPALLATIEAAAADIIAAFQRRKKVLFCGNGGSAADAQHLAAELSGRFYFDRPPLYAEALHVNTSYVTAVANDYSYDEIFVRSVRGCGREGDVLVGLTTSGNSTNVRRAVEAAKELGMTTIALTGETGGKLKGLCTHLINVPSRDTARIQESHILVGHAMCELVEESLFGAQRKA